MFINLNEAMFAFAPRLSLLVGLALILAACDSSGPDPDPVPLEVQLAEDIEADPAAGRDPVTGAPLANNLYTLYDLDARAIVVSSSVTDAAQRSADSTAAKWDIGFKGTTIIFNGGTSGPGQGTAQLVSEPFVDVKEAPSTGYAADGSNTGCPPVETPAGTFPGSPLAICTGSDNGWYNYNGQTQLIIPVAGRTIVLTTGEGLYAKVRILSYYKGNPNPPDPTAPSRYFTFEYILQPDGSKNFETTTPS